MTDNRTRLLSIVAQQIGAIQTTAADPINARFSELGEDATLADLLDLIERKIAAKVPA